VVAKLGSIVRTPKRIELPAPSPAHAPEGEHVAPPAEHPF
jgi:hypothetical protein